MYVTEHAYNRLLDRVGWVRADEVVERLTPVVGEPGTVAYIVARLPELAKAKDGSNGDIVVAVAVDGSVDTVYLRRSGQDMSARFFRAERVVSLT